MTGANTNLFFSDFARPVALTDCEDVIDAMIKVFVGWNIRQKDQDNIEAPIIKLSHRDNKYLWLSDKIPPPKRWKKRLPTTVPSVVADFHYKFYDWYRMNFPQHLCLHCAAVEISGGLVIFPNIKKVGKSTLATRLAMAGYRVFCDDVLAYCPERKLGLALGILPRVRLPLPDALPLAYKEYIHANKAVGSQHYAYIKPTDGTFAGYGETMPIHAVVKLDRNKECDVPEITELSQANAVSAILHQNFVLENTASVIFDQVLAMLEPCRLLTMRYNNLDDAAIAVVEAIKARLD